MGSLRSLLGLCEHKWRALAPGTLIEVSLRPVSAPSKKHVTGYLEPRECEKCGAVRSFRI